jgi:hypothetical protein
MIHQVGALEPADIEYRRRADRCRVMHAFWGSLQMQISGLCSRVSDSTAWLGSLLLVADEQ